MSKSRFVQISSPYTLTHSVAPQYAVGSTTGWITQSWTDGRADGVAVPFWRAKIRSGSSATSGLSGNKTTYEGQPGSLHATWKQFPTDVRASFYLDSGTFIVPNSWSHLLGNGTEAENQALSRLYQAIRDQQSHWKGLVAFGEFGETMRSIHRAANVLANGLPRYLTRQYKLIERVLGFPMYDKLHRYPSDTGRALWREKMPRQQGKKRALNKALADAWLTYAFEWRPLVKDIQQGAETIARWNLEGEMSNGLYHTAVRGYGKTVSVVANTVQMETFDGFTFPVRRMRKLENECIFRAGYHGEGLRPVGEHSFSRLGELAGFGWRDFIPSVWQLLPWSFLVDYFVNVGDLLSCMFTATDGVTWINKTTRVVNRELGTGGNVSSFSGGGTFGGSPGSYEKTTQTFTRTTGSGIGLPSVSFRWPGVDSNAWINILALLQGR